MRRESMSALIFAIVAGYGGPVVSAEPTLEQVVATLRQRERSHAAGRMEWTDRSYRRGLSGIDDSARAPGDDRTTAKRVFAWKGNRMSYRFEAQVFDRGLS